MRGRIGFFDTSAIVPLCVAQQTTQQARQLYRGFTRHVVAWTTLIEAAGALYRAVTLGALSESTSRVALNQLAQLEGRWSEIVPSDRLRGLALELLRLHDLRAGDAIQLASALVWCNHKPARRTFVSFDEKLARVAHAVGFEVLKAR